MSVRLKDSISNDSTKLDYFPLYINDLVVAHFYASFTATTQELTNEEIEQIKKSRQDIGIGKARFFKNSEEYLKSLDEDVQSNYLSNASEWHIVEPPDIRKIFKRLGQPEKDQYREAIRTLAKSQDPRVHGSYKKHQNCFTYDITSSFRIAFEIDYQNRTIHLLSVGDHKQIYGKDKHSQGHVDSMY